MTDPPCTSEAPVTVTLKNLESGNVPFSALEDAFGPSSLGIMVVSDVRPEFAELRLRLLSYAAYLGNLPSAELDKLECPEAKYLTGWSRGKETLKNGQFDTLKGSFYANCAFYVSPDLDRASSTPDFPLANAPAYLSPNVWPSESLLPGFRRTFEELCTLIIDTGVLVARACDRYAIQKIPDYTPGYLEHVVKTSTTTKARLLHYFPAIESEDARGTSGDSKEGDDDNWCATHLDHGCLTGLTSAMFMNETESPAVVPIEGSCKPSSRLAPLTELPSSPDPAAGLYIQSRAGKRVQIKIPRDCIAFQTGEALQRITQGMFRAVPHFVRGVGAGMGGEGARVTRNTLAVFMQPSLGDLVDTRQGITFGEFARGVVEKNTPA